MRLRGVRASRKIEDRRRVGKRGAGIGGRLQAGEMAAALNAARRIGKDDLRPRAGRVPQPHGFTHGTGERRSRRFATGHDRGRMSGCDTFGAERS